MFPNNIQSKMSKILAANPNSKNDIPLVRKIGQFSVEAYSNTSVDQHRYSIQVAAASGGGAANIIEGGTLDFNIVHNPDRISSVYLKVDYTNSTANPCVVACPLTHIAHIEIFSSNQSNRLYSMASAISHFLIDSVMLSRNEWENTAELRGTDENYSTAPVTIAANASGSFYYHIAPHFWRSTKLRPFCLEGELVVRLRFHPKATTIVSGSLNTPNIVLEINGYKESEWQKNLLKARKNYLKSFSYYAPQIHAETQTLSAGNKCSIRLTGISGYVNQIYFTIRAEANAAIPANLFTFARPASFDFVNPNGITITGKPQTASDMVIMYSHPYDNLFIKNTNACVWAFSQSPVADVASGNWHGGHEMRGTHSLEFTPAAGLVTGRYEIQVVAMCNESLDIERSVAKTSR